jgi:hypothetical protein
MIPVFPCVFPWTTMGVGVVVHGVYTRLCILQIDFFQLVLVDIQYNYVTRPKLPIETYLYLWIYLLIEITITFSIHSNTSIPHLSIFYLIRWCCCAWGIYPPVYFANWFFSTCSRPDYAWNISDWTLNKQQPKLLIETYLYPWIYLLIENYNNIQHSFKY